VVLMAGPDAAVTGYWLHLGPRFRNRRSRAYKDAGAEHGLGVGVGAEKSDDEKAAASSQEPWTLRRFGNRDLQDGTAQTGGMEDDGPLLSIGELARRSGLPVRTIRFWSDAGLVPRRLGPRAAGGCMTRRARPGLS
jgi:hypothetical protein